MGIVIKDERTGKEFEVPQEIAAEGGEKLEKWVKENTPKPMQAKEEADPEVEEKPKSTTKAKEK